MSLGRALRHLLAPPWQMARAFPPSTLQRVEEAIAATELLHRGEVRFAVESGLDFFPVLRGLTARQRALEVFSQLKVWDTEENSGVLLYVQLADRDIEIVADRGIAGVIPQAHWEAICARMQRAFAAREFEAGTLAGIAQIGELLTAHFPAGARNADELPNRPVQL